MLDVRSQNVDDKPARRLSHEGWNDLVFIWKEFAFILCEAYVNLRLWNEKGDRNGIERKNRNLSFSDE